MTRHFRQPSSCLLFASRVETNNATRAFSVASLWSSFLVLENIIRFCRHLKTYLISCLRSIAPYRVIIHMLINLTLLTDFEGD